MGQTLKNLSSKQISFKSVFNNRFVVEICETVHTHYRNLRISQSLSDWLEMAEGIVDSLDRWKKRGEPQPGKKHIELCRKQVAVESKEDMIKINLNKNLYPDHEGRIFSEGAEIEDPEYIHLKIRDLRFELSINDFKVFSEAVKEARERLLDHEFSKSGSPDPMLQTR